MASIGPLEGVIKQSNMLITMQPPWPHLKYDQMARLFVQYLVNYNNEYLPSSIKCSKNLYPYAKSTLKNCQRILKFRQIWSHCSLTPSYHRVRAVVGTWFKPDKLDQFGTVSSLILDNHPVQVKTLPSLHHVSNPGFL